MLSPAFKHPPVYPKLEAGRVHVWLGMLDQPAPTPASFIQTLSPEEKHRAGRFHFEMDRNRFVARRGMLRMILGGYLGVTAGELEFRLGENGKPAMMEAGAREKIHFNLSHSGGVALFAFSGTCEVGVDIERVRDIYSMEELVDRYFSAGEKLYFRSLPPDRRKEAFFHFWTRKEAFLKGTGEGLSRPLNGFQVMTEADKDSGGACPIYDNTTGVSAWTVQGLNLGRGYAGSLATNRKDFTLHRFKWVNTAFADQAINRQPCDRSVESCAE